MTIAITPKPCVAGRFPSSGVAFTSGSTCQRSAQSTMEAVLLLAASAVLLLGLIIFAGNEHSNGKTLFGRTRELVCGILDGGTNRVDGERESADDESPIDFDQITPRSPRSPGQASAARQSASKDSLGTTSRMPNLENDGKTGHKFSLKTKVTSTPKANIVGEYSNTDEKTLGEWHNVSVRSRSKNSAEASIGTHPDVKLKSKNGFVIGNKYGDELFVNLIGSVGRDGGKVGIEAGFKTQFSKDVSVTGSLRKDFGNIKALDISLEPLEMTFDPVTQKTTTKFAFEATIYGTTAAFGAEIVIPDFITDLRIPESVYEFIPDFVEEWWQNSFTRQK